MSCRGRVVAVAIGLNKQSISDVIELVTNSPVFDTYDKNFENLELQLSRWWKVLTDALLLNDCLSILNLNPISKFVVPF